MFIHISVSKGDAKLLYDMILRDRRLAEGDNNEPEVFSSYFAQYLQKYLDRLDANLCIDRRDNLYVLKFNGYLSRMPAILTSLHIIPIAVEVVRFNSAPTSARAGYYESFSAGFSALVERIFPVQYNGGSAVKVAPLYAQNIRVKARTLDEALDFNSRLSAGLLGEFMVNAFE